MYIINTQAILWEDVFKSYDLISKTLLRCGSNTRDGNKNDGKDYKQRDRNKSTIEYHACTLPLDSSGSHEILTQYLALDMTLSTPTRRVQTRLRCTIDETSIGFLGNIIESLDNSRLTMWRQFGRSRCTVGDFLLLGCILVLFFCRLHLLSPA